ncbi:MAG: hypothetical protein FWD47_14565 [Treponema sp.]|nr:hypothetical protein [Treponema sp.]
MNRDEFTAAYLDFAKLAIRLAQKARKEGISSLEENIDSEKVKELDIFHYGLRLVIDGTEPEIIVKMLLDIISQQKNIKEYSYILKLIQMDAVLAIMSGYHPSYIYYKLNSFTDL